MKRIVMASAALLVLAASPAMAMSCCGGGKGKGAMMCGKAGGTAMSQGSMNTKGGCCCDGMARNMSKRGQGRALAG